MDFDAFLNLFVSQLRYQDPLNPVANEDFLAQTAQFSSVEQLVSLNGLVKGLAAELATSPWTTAAALIGRQVEATVEAADGTLWAAEGRVVSVDTGADGALLLGLEDGTEVPLEAVTAVREVPPAPA